MSFCLFALSVCHPAGRKPENVVKYRREKLLFEIRDTSRLSNVWFPTLRLLLSDLIFRFGFQVASFFLFFFVDRIILLEMSNCKHAENRKMLPWFRRSSLCADDSITGITAFDPVMLDWGAGLAGGGVADQRVRRPTEAGC